MDGEFWHSYTLYYPCCNHNHKIMLSIPVPDERCAHTYMLMLILQMGNVYARMCMGTQGMCILRRKTTVNSISNNYQLIIQYLGISLSLPILVKYSEQLFLPFNDNNYLLLLPLTFLLLFLHFVNLYGSCSYIFLFLEHLFLQNYFFILILFLRYSFQLTFVMV